MPEELEKEITKDNRIAADWLLWVDEREIDLKERRSDILNASGGALNAAGITIIGKGQKPTLKPGKTWQVPYNSTHPSSDTTGSRAALLGDLQDDERWVDLIRDVERKLSWEKRTFLLLRRDCRQNVGRVGWLSYCQHHLAHEIAVKMGKKVSETMESKNALGERWRQIIDITCRLALKRGLL